MSEPTCANCPKGRTWPYALSKIECRAHPPLVVFGESAEFPVLPSDEVCHEHPALQAAERAATELHVGPAHDPRPGPRDMCELEEGGRPDSDAVLCACGGAAVIATQGAYGAIVGTCAACMQGSRVIDVRETPSEEAPDATP